MVSISFYGVMKRGFPELSYVSWLKIKLTKKKLKVMDIEIGFDEF